MLIEAARITVIVAVALIMFVSAAKSQLATSNRPLEQYQAELTKAAQERDAGSAYVAALLTQLADTKAQAAAADQQLAADGARIANLIAADGERIANLSKQVEAVTKERDDAMKERDELKAKAGAAASGTVGHGALLLECLPPHPDDEPGGVGGDVGGGAGQRLPP
jgi:septal ring factor EnvC (AmiA/AmiB activator)